MIFHVANREAPIAIVPLEVWLKTVKKEMRFHAILATGTSIQPTLTLKNMLLEQTLRGLIAQESATYTTPIIYYGVVEENIMRACVFMYATNFVQMFKIG